jgi:cytochrome c oxidase subunit 2
MTVLYWISTATAQESAFYLPKAASTLAGDVDYTFSFIYWCCAIFFIALMGAMFWFAVAYKDQGPDHKTLDLKGHHTLELVWSVFPSFLLIAMFVMGFQGYVKSTISPVDAVQVNVVGKRWDWSFNYPTLGGFESRDLVVPNQEAVRLQMVSQDVLHSFYIPDFRIKKDVLPNRYTSQWFETTDLFEATEEELFYSPDFNYSDAKESPSGSKILVTSRGADVQKAVADQCAKDKKSNPELACESNPENVKVGLHQIFCTEYCGDSHSRMLAKAVVLEPADFELWVKAQNNFDAETAYAGDVTKLGEYYTSKGGCAGCHSVDGSVMTGPTWKGLYNKERKFADGSTAVADDNYIRMSVLEPQKQVVEGYPAAGMPVNLHKAFGKGKEEAGLSAIIEYIKTLN